MINLTATTPKPTFVTNAQNGLGVVRFSGTSNGLTSGSPLNIRHIFLTAKFNGSSLDGFRSLLSTPDTDFLLALSGSVFYDIALNTPGYPVHVRVNGVAVASDAIPIPFNTWKLYEIRFLVDPYPASGLNLGQNTAEDLKWNGDVGELIICTKLLESDGFELTEHLMTKWGIH